MLRRLSVFASVIAVLLLQLSACGGGGGGGGHKTPQTPTPSATVSGVAGKGLLLNAIVNFYPVSNGVAGTTALAMVRTDATTGAFSSPISSAGPVLVVVTVDSSTQMLDELSGNAMPAPVGLTLHAVFGSLTNVQPIGVTPVTEMVYALATAATGGLTPANIDAAANAVSTAFLGGASALNTQPIDIENYASAPVAQQQLAKLLVALAVAADQGSATDASGAPCAAGDYGQRLVCMIGGLGNLIALNSSNEGVLQPSANYIGAAYALINSGHAIVNGQSPHVLALDVATQAETAFLAAVATQAPLPGYDPGASPLANTKALLADIRTNLIDSATQSFAPTVQALADDVRDNVRPVLTGVGGALSAMKVGSDLLVAAKASPNVETYKASGSVFCGYDPVRFGATNLTVCRYGDWYSPMLLTVLEAGPGVYTVNTLTLVLNSTVGGVPSQVSPVLYAPFGGFYLPSTLPVLEASFVITAETGMKFPAGMVTGPLYVTPSGGQVSVALSLAVSTDWNTATGTGTLTPSGTLSNGAGGVSLTSATIGSDSAVVIKDLPRDVLALLNSTDIASLTAPPSVEGVLDVTELTTASFSYAAKLTLGTPVLDKSGKVAPPGSIDLTGSIARLGSGGTTPLFNGHISAALMGIDQFDATQPFSETNSVTAQVQVAGDLALGGGRLLSVMASANGDRLEATPEHPHSLLATYSYVTPRGTAVLNAQARYDSVNGYSATITNNAGVSATVTKSIAGDVAGTVTANGQQTATLSGSQVNYNDGSVESLF